MNNMQQLDKEAFCALGDPQILQQLEGLVARAHARGDGVAAYENVDLSDSNVGHLRFVSYGSPAAQLEVSLEQLPQFLPQIGSQRGWQYQVKAVCPPGGKA